VLANGDFTRKLSFKVAAVSATAKEKIEKAGGDVTVDAPAEKRGKQKGSKAKAATAAEKTES
jgi:large subunit ribosomal protein L15